MCRKTVLYGGILIAAGSGLLLGLLIGSGFLQLLLGLGLIGLGGFLILK